MDNDAPEIDWADYVPGAADGTTGAAPAPAPDPAPAATAPTDPAPATPADPADPADDATEQRPARRGRDVYARRRRRYTNLVLAVLALAGWFAWSHHSSSTSTAAPTVHTATGDEANPATPAAIAADLATAQSTLASRGTLDGLTLPGARVAAAGSTMYASRELTGVCWAYAIVGGTPTDARVDTTGAVCSDAAIAATQQQLDAANGAATTAARRSAVAALQQAAALVGYYGSRNMVGGVPDLTGLVMPDSTVVASENTGSHVRLTTGSGTTCETVVVAADGTAGLPAACH